MSASSVDAGETNAHLPPTPTDESSPCAVGPHPSPPLSCGRFCVNPRVPQPLEHALEHIVGLGARHEQPLVDQPSGHAAGT